MAYTLHGKIDVLYNAEEYCPLIFYLKGYTNTVTELVLMCHGFEELYYLDFFSLERNRQNV